MQGHARKRGNTWTYVIDVGKIDGKRKQKTKGGFKTKKEALAAMNDLINQLNKTGTFFELQQKSFDELFNEFIKKECPETRAHSTIKRYLSLYNNHFKENFGYKYIHSINGDEMRDYLYSLVETHSRSYIKSMYNMLGVLFTYAIQRNYIKNNPLEFVAPPKLPKREITILTDNQINWLFNRASTTNLQPAICIALNSGVRAGENYALRWSDIDFDNNVISIDKQLTVYNKAWVLSDTKTSNSDRVIEFGEVLKNYLLALKDKQDTNRKELGIFYKPNRLYDIRGEKPILLEIDDFINVKPDGEMLNSHSHKVISRIAKEELKIKFKYHSLRHTYATKLLEGGASIKFVQEQLGHSSPRITLEIYAHVSDKMKKNASQMIDDAFSFLLTT